MTSIIVRDRLLGAVFGLMTTLVLAVLAFLLFDVLKQGLSSLSLEFFIDNPSKAGRAGGIFSIILSTLMVVGIAVLAAIPIGLGTALFLSEFTRFRSPYAIFVRRSLDVLAGVPSIVFGLFGNAFFSVYLGLGFSILSGGLTLACMILPLIIRTAEESFRTIPDQYRRGIAALGFSKTAAIFKLYIPYTAPGLMVGVILGIGRAIAETAALIFTSGYVDRTPESVFDSGRTLSVHIYDLAMNIPGGDNMAYATSLVLVLMLLFISLLTSLITKVFLQRGILQR